jgi:hypothetical protein
VEKPFSIPSSERLTETAARAGDLFLLEFLINYGVAVRPGNVLLAAARQGHLDLIRWADVRLAQLLTPKHWKSTLLGAIHFGQADIAEWIYSRNSFSPSDIAPDDLSFPLSGRTKELEFLYRKGALSRIPENKWPIDILAARGHLEALKFLYSISTEKEKTFRDVATFAGLRKRKILLWAKEKGLPNMSLSATDDKSDLPFSDLSSLIWAHKNKLNDWDSLVRLTSQWERQEDLEALLLYSKDNGLPFPRIPLLKVSNVSTIRWAHQKDILLFDKDILGRLSGYPNVSLDDLLWLKGIGCPVNPRAFDGRHLAYARPFEIFKFAFENGMKYDDLYLLQRYAAAGQLDRLRYGRSVGMLPSSLGFHSLLLLIFL